jgi:hypothetical protein
MTVTGIPMARSDHDPSNDFLESVTQSHLQI